MSELDDSRKIRLIDTHCHLYREYFNDLDEVLDRSLEGGIATALVPGYDIRTSIEALEMSMTNDWILSAAGVHPTSSFENPKREIEILTSFLECSADKVSAIGETGIDLFHSTDNLSDQLLLFEGHLDLCLKFDKPVIIHCRNSADVVVDALDQHRYDGRGIFHCYDGSASLLGYARERSFGISFAGNVTYPNAAVLRKMLEVTPDDLVLIETDAPFLAPKPLRGRRNEPANVIHTLHTIAEVKGWGIDQAAEIIYSNFVRIMNLEE